MKYLFLIPFFFFPLTAHGAFNVVQASSTHALGFDISDVDLSGTASEIRVFPPGISVYSRNNACAMFVAPFGLPNQDIDDNYVFIRPVSVSVNNYYQNNIVANIYAHYNCRQAGVHTVGLFTGAGDVTLDASDTIYLEQYPLDLRSLIILLFLVGAMLAVLRPVISKLTLR